MNARERERYRSTLKHPDVEEHIDLWFYRPLGFRLALLGERLGWTPNAVTTASIVLGVACGVLCYPSDVALNIVGILMLVAADICDSADGQLARLTGQYSRLGRILDGASGDLWFIAIYVAIVLRLTPTWGVWIWLIAAAAGACHAVQAMMADRYRNFHLYVVRGARGSELDDAATVAAEYDALRLSDEPLYTFFMFFYAGYTRRQEQLSPSLQHLRRQMAEHPELVTPAWLASLRESSRPLMWVANALTFNWRAIVLTLSLVAGRPWLYFVAELTLGNVLLLYMIVRHERMCNRHSLQQ